MAVSRKGELFCKKAIYAKHNYALIRRENKICSQTVLHVRVIIEIATYCQLFTQPAPRRVESINCNICDYVCLFPPFSGRKQKKEE